MSDLSTHLAKLETHLARYHETGILNLIGGKDTAGSSTFETRSPVDESLICTVARGTAADIDAAAKAAKRVLATGFNLRYYPFVSFVREMVNSGVIGKVDHVRIYGGHVGLSSFGHEWEYKQPHSGGGFTVAAHRPGQRQIEPVFMGAQPVAQQARLSMAKVREAVILCLACCAGIGLSMPD